MIVIQTSSKRFLSNLRRALGDECFTCHSVMNLEFAHLSSTDLRGAGRGSAHRYADVTKHPECYSLLCKNCHYDFDAGLLEIPESIGQRAIFIRPRPVNVRRLLETYSRADSIDMEEGRVAYPRYQSVMRGLADYYGYSLSEVTAVFCSLSPNSDYAGNLRSAATLLKAHNQGVEPERAIVTTYNQNKYRAWRYLDGEDFLTLAKGPKIRAFYRNILDPADPEQPVTIDGHMISVWVGRRLTMVEAVRHRDKLLRKKYEDIANDFRTAAKRVCLTGPQLQSTLWFTWKRINNIIFKPQLKLFADRDQWETLQAPEDIHPFPFLSRRELCFKLSQSEESPEPARAVS